MSKFAKYFLAAYLLMVGLVLFGVTFGVFTPIVAIVTAILLLLNK